MSVLKFRRQMNDIKATSNAIWWIRDPSKQWAAQKQRKQSDNSSSFSQDFVDLFRNMALHGYGRLFDPDLYFWEKLIWFALHTTTLCCLLTVLAASWEKFVSQYIVVNLHNPIYPVEMVPFPAISICTSNRLSRQAVMQYADELKQKDPNNHSIEYFLERITRFTILYYKYEADNAFDDSQEFQAFLDEYDTWDNETFYDTRRKMYMLTPKCSDLLLKCTLAGEDIDCFSKTAFQESLTMYGPCCTFNLEDSYRQRTYRNRFVNRDLGLMVVLNTSGADDFASISNIDSYIVVVHDPYEFPDKRSGGSQEVFPQQNEESFVTIKANVIDTEDALRSFNPITRKCYFDNEAPNQDLLLKETYSFSNCITRCRIQSIMALCRCLPFFMPLDLIKNDDGVIYCTLQHNSCLLRYNYKWHNVLTQRVLIQGLEREAEEALYCPQCLPSCVDILYHISLLSLPMDRFHATHNLDVIQKNKLNEEDISVLRVHFLEPHARYYMRVLSNAWFEAFCTVGNILSIFLGLSIIAAFEFTYFIIKHIIMAIKRSFKSNESEETNEALLYICP